MHKVFKNKAQGCSTPLMREMDLHTSDLMRIIARIDSVIITKFEALDTEDADLHVVKRCKHLESYNSVDLCRVLDRTLNLTFLI